MKVDKCQGMEWAKQTAPRGGPCDLQHEKVEQSEQVEASKEVLTS